MNEETQARRAGIPDLPRLISLAAICAGAPQWSQAVWQEVIESSEDSGARVVLVVERRDEIVGFGIASLSADDAEIESVAVDPALRRQGIGRLLCEEMLDWARASGAVQALLEVRVSNGAARALYESLGFDVRRVRKGYYQQPVEDAIVMSLRLPI
jgi:[ribosomal protein S18]-alanine N-acetyltransferase